MREEYFLDINTQNTNIPREESSQLPATSQGYVLPEGKIMPNTIFVGGIDIRMDETEIRTFFTQYGTVKEVKIITDRTGMIQKILIKLKLGPAIRKHPNLCAYHVPPRPMLINSPTPQFHSVWSNQETYLQSPAVMSPVTQYVQSVNSFLTYCFFKIPPQWLPGEPRNYIVPVSHISCIYLNPVANIYNDQRRPKSVDRSIQTVVSCLCNPDNRLRNNIVTQEDYLKEKRAHHFRRSRAVLKTV
uniref:RRM domain-containing protein n=1 Tax=Laticauda laticaudata TaxID=8630 RepID=A0A8C5S6H5_LATLA